MSANQNGRVQIDASRVISNSVRFFPIWDPLSNNLIEGLIHICLDIVKLGPKLIGAEIGSLWGESAGIFLSFPEISLLHCVDRQIQEALRARLNCYKSVGRCMYHQTSSAIAANTITGSLDFVYIDADHSYESVADDIRCWYPKIRRGGMLCGHDYIAVHSGVIKAVDEFALNHDYEVKLYKDTSWSLIKK